MAHKERATFVIEFFAVLYDRWKFYKTPIRQRIQFSAKPGILNLQDIVIFGTVFKIPTGVN
jgi:hypothetical protein